MSKDLGWVTEEMVKAGRKATLAVGADPVSGATLSAIYLAMQAAAPAAVADGERYREVLIEARGELLRQQRGGDPDREEHCSSIIKHIDRVLAPEAAASDQGE